MLSSYPIVFDPRIWSYLIVEEVIKNCIKSVTTKWGSFPYYTGQSITTKQVCLSIKKYEWVDCKTKQICYKLLKNFAFIERWGMAKDATSLK